MIKERFVPYKDEAERPKARTVNVYLNEEEARQLEIDMRLLRQAKDSTALKQLWQVGRNMAHDNKTGLILRTVMKNVELNQRTGVVLRELKSDTNLAENSNNSGRTGREGVPGQERDDLL